MTVTVPTWFPVLSPSDVAIDQSFEGLIHHSRFSNTQRALLQGTPVVALSFTSTTFKTQLWQSTVDIITEQLCQASTHPTFVQTLGVVGTVEADATNTSLYHLSPSYVVMEAMPVSLYDILHVEQLPLTREHIILIATEILRGLQFLHHRNQSFGSTLTSRKVMLGSTRHIKLRRFGLEQIGQKAETPDLVAASYASLSHYIDQNGHGHDESADILDLKAADQAVTKEVRDKQCEDIYAFGVLLLEMTTHEKPNVEIFNRISSTAQVDPVLETVIRLALGVTPSGSRSGVTYPRELLNKCLESLSSIKLQHRVVAVDGGKPPHSVISFPSFVQADDYVQRHESAVVLKSVGDRDRQNEVALKRLAAVEEDLVEEQKNFEIVVRQLEQAKIVLGHRDDELEQETQRTRALHEEIAAHDEMVSNLQNDRNTALRTIEELQDTITSYEERLEQSRIARLAIERERQELLVEIMKLKDEKRAVLDQKAEVESQYAAVAAKVGSEKEAIEELEGRYTQAIHRWKHEQAARAQVERRLEAISQQLVAMEDERARFSAALQSTPLGGRDPRESSDYVLDLKEKCIASLQNDIQQMQKAMEELQSDLERSQSENHRLQQVVITDLEQQTEKLMDELRNLEQHFVEEQETTTELTKQLEEITLEHDLLKQKAFALDLEVAEMKKKADDEEQARRQRRCLTPNCDAPKYLVRPSGYCVECIEKMAKGTPSGSTRKTPAVTAAAHLTGQKTFLDAPRNMQTVEILRSIENAREDLSPEDDDPRNESMTELVCLLKQFSTLLKENATLKEDLPECNALRAILTLMEQFARCLPVQLEITKLMSVIVFNHDRNRIILVAEGAVELICRMMKTFPRDVKAQESCAVALTNLSHNCETNRQRIEAVGCIDAILQAMQTFPRHPTLQTKCCWALLTLAGSDFMCGRIAALGGLGAILAAMLNCPGDANLQHYGSWALLNLVSGTPRLQQFARQEGVIEVTEAAIACFPEHTGIQENCRQILHLVSHSNS